MCMLWKHCAAWIIFFLWETRPPLLQPLPFAFFILHYLRMCYQISPAKPPPNEITEIRVDVMTKKSSSYFSLWPPFWAINKLWFVFNKYYRTWAIVSRSLYNFNPIFKLQSNLFSGLFSIKFCCYYSRAGYNGVGIHYIYLTLGSCCLLYWTGLNYFIGLLARLLM